MTIKTWLAVATVVVAALCALPLLTVVADTTAASACGPTAAGGSGRVVLREHPGPVGKWTSSQVDNAATIVAVGRHEQIPPRGWVIAVATAMTESRLINTSEVTDHDSIGLFQQRPSQGWGTPEQLVDPVYVSNKFYTVLQKVKGWPTLPLTEAAQTVQRSAFPDRYADYEADAETVVTAVTSGDALAISGGRDQCVSVCTAATSSSDGDRSSCVGVSTVFDRAKTWLTAWPGGGPVPYLSSNVPGDLLHGYRRDCSGYVSMALGLSGPGLTTVDLAEQSARIAKAELRPGDLMINPDTDLRGHVVLFAGWVDASMNRYYGYEQTGSGGTHYRSIPYPYFGTYPMTPYRARPS
ncbi:NlpC/P60 family protein [Winogradskya humida]|uniref:NlpC/P60 family protein n=1 Tax=Winogradskya humida TaxID=113566 RepID=A0ABQ4A218_9ACTN|nr:NlpC/P60 family protein [Actinoplanes humidus]GIE24881.1 hypothetical protein Ahu01nite_079830 [Actinoplanes humidus]